MNPTTIKFSPYTSFNSAEIEQIISLVKHASHVRPIDRRRYSKNVIAWGLNYRLLYRGGERTWPGEDPKRIYVNSSFSAMDLPIFVIWKMVDLIIGDRSGYSIARQNGWLDLNIYPAGDHNQSERDRDEMFRIMVKLQTHRFIIFQCAGEIWSVTRMPENEWWINDCF